MPLIEIDDDVYQYLLGRAVRIGESGSSILRRELGLSEPNGGSGEQDASPQENSKPREVEELEKLLTDPRFNAEKVVTKKYLRLLGFLAEQHGGEFEQVLGIRGRTRVYFGRSREEIATRGKSSHPRKIPGSGYWAMTNADTAQKQEILADVLGVLGYPKDLIRQAWTSLR
jgi:negative regulator of replication initiation